MESSYTNSNQATQRLHALDFFRGLTMFLLIVEFTGLFNLLTHASLEGSWIHALGMQFHHHPWAGLRFWDLIQPFFMFIVGVAIPFSVHNRLKKGQEMSSIRLHAWQRAFLLLFFGWVLYCIGPGKIVFRFQNVLAQLSVTYLIAFLLMNQRTYIQIIASILFVGLTELIYRTFSIEGFDQAFIPLQNFGTWLDLQYGGADLHGSWVSFNAIPTTAHTIWGVLAGQLLLGNKPPNQKWQSLMIAGILCLFIGYTLSFVTPIIKRICTSSFIFVSGGWTILALALSYGLIDILKLKKGIWIFTIVGLNPLFIYLFAHIGGADLLQKVVLPFTNGAFFWVGELMAAILTSLAVLFLLWYICYWLYQKRIFIRI